MNKRWSKHSHAIKILEETGRERESKAAGGESVLVVCEEIMETPGSGRWCYSAARANEISQKQLSEEMTLCMSRYTHVGPQGISDQ